MTWLPFLGLFGRSKVAAASKRRPRRTILRVEALEGRDLPSCSSLSGYVFSDTNNNGLKDANEPGIAGVMMELHNSNGDVIGTATTDSKGFYQFTTDSTADTTAMTMSQ